MWRVVRSVLLPPDSIIFCLLNSLKGGPVSIYIVGIFMLYLIWVSPAWVLCFFKRGERLVVGSSFVFSLAGDDSEFLYCFQVLLSHSTFSRIIYRNGRDRLRGLTRPKLPPNENNFSWARFSFLRRLRHIKRGTTSWAFAQFASPHFRICSKYILNSPVEVITRAFISSWN